VHIVLMHLVATAMYFVHNI